MPELIMSSAGEKECEPRLNLRGWCSIRLTFEEELKARKNKFLFFAFTLLNIKALASLIVYGHSSFFWTFVQFCYAPLANLLRFHLHYALYSCAVSFELTL